MRIVQEGLTFDDVLLLPAHSNVLPKDVDLKTSLTRTISLNIPLLSAAMDTVTEARAAICLAQEGGLGIIHKNITPVRQADEVRRVKKFEAGIISNPITVTPDTTIRKVLELTRAQHISGVPVTQGDKLVGIVTSRDLRFETRYEEPVSRIMTPQEDRKSTRLNSSHSQISYSVLFFLNDAATTEISPLSLHDALPISWASSPAATCGSRPATRNRCRAS